MSRKGGYIILDFKGLDVPSIDSGDRTVKKEGIYSEILENLKYGKVFMLSGLKSTELSYLNPCDSFVEDVKTTFIDSNGYVELFFNGYSSVLRIYNDNSIQMRDN